MVNDEADGGVRGLRLWADDAIERAARLIARSGEGTVSPTDFDAPVAELSGLRGLLDHDRPLLGAVTVRLGCLLAIRYATGNGTPEDRERARRLLHEARDPSTPAGEAVTAQDRQMAALLLMTVSGSSVPLGTPGAAPDFWHVFDRAQQMGSVPAAEEAAELAALAAEAAAAGPLPLPPELLEQLTLAQNMLTHPALTDLSDPEALLAMLPDGFPFADQLRMLVDLAKDLPDTPADPAKPPRPDGEDDSDDDTVTASWLAAMFGTTDALRTGDPEQVSRLLKRLGADLDRLPEGHDRAPEIENLMRLVLQTGMPLSGGHQDTDAARDHAQRITEHFERQAASDPAAAGLVVGNRAMNLLGRVREAEDAESAEDLAALVDELESLERSVPDGDPFRPLVRLALGSALTSLGASTRDTGALLRGFTAQEETLNAMTTASLGVPEALADALRDTLRTARALVGDAPDLMPEYTPPGEDASTETRYLSALAATMRHSLTRDPADLDAAIGELGRVRDRVRQGRSPQIAAPALWQLAENHRLRLERTQDPADRDAATNAALESLQALAGDVVLQDGPDHGLLTARSGADRGIRAAIWAATQGRVEEAVAALELGRALVLQAASTSRAVPELLEARGHHDLAREWRAAGAAPDGGQPGALPRELPSSLRRRALEALGHREPGGALFRTPTVEELKAGVAEGDADALVYLLAGEGGLPGMAIVVGPDTGTGVRALPLLSGEHSGPLERYIDAAARHQASPGDAAATEAWEDALSELCDWATGAMVAPVMSGLAERLAANEDRRRDRPGPPRIVLVPCGRLGIVPWHAARFPAGAPHTYACEAIVFSYAASGRQFLDTVRRARRDPGADAVLVADPSLSLPYADLEVTALRRSLYPGARLYGELYAPPVEPEGAGTPDDLVGVLAGTPSLLHVACHGSAGPSPTASALQLAYPEDTAEPRPGLLTVSRLLGHRAGEEGVAGERGTADGPLIVLSACETDLSRRDHDEALTLTTAFVAGGARDVVGSRWATRDAASALMMAVFHHHVAAEGRSPVDALRAAQMWMLDPHRTAPGTLGGDLLDELAKGPVLDRPAAWAAFIHQGHPGPAESRR
ncbi:CHAT domain-containing protein [Streptomyces sp. SID5910]|uniref:CHAT domain-containing protein n=1 Tax=Streptomyces sp. SID5910 TaxID=2690312 RepID=UPI00136B2A4A|nr:CHAT domain-containing protein [Streptomyces sp. SID5910]MYR45432.1 CHAT domain-containing protein [Streptomyces sp. SID5910]